MPITSSRRALCICIFAIACERSSDSPPPAAPAPSPAAMGSAPSTNRPVSRDSTKPGCVHTGLWAVCSVENRIRQAGFVAKRVQGQATQRPGFSVKPIVYTLGRSHLEVFIYPDEASLSRDLARMDTIAVAPVGSAGSWGETPPLLIRSGNLAAVLLSQNPRQAERLSLALTAGAPQAGSPR